MSLHLPREALGPPAPTRRVALARHVRTACFVAGFIVSQGITVMVIHLVGLS